MGMGEGGKGKRRIMGEGRKKEEGGEIKRRKGKKEIGKGRLSQKEKEKEGRGKRRMGRKLGVTKGGKEM